MAQKIAIIGAGISGLVAGVYAQKNGFEAEIYEALPNVGGECTGWDRNSYHFDGCIEFLTGTKAGTDLNDIWATCGALDGDVQILNRKYDVAYNDNGKLYYTYNNYELLKKELLRVSPEDKEHIELLIKMMTAFSNISKPAKRPMELMSKGDKLKFILKYIPMGSAFKAGSKITVKEFLKGFKSEKIRAMLSCMVPMQCSALGLFATMGGMCSGDGGWPMGGSAAFSNRIKEKFLSLGGKLNLGTMVKRIVIKTGVATGIAIENDGVEKIIFADFVVPAVDAKVLFDKLLGGKYHEKFFDERYSDPERYFLLSTVSVFLGVDADLSQIPHNCIFKSKNPVDVGGGTEDYVAFKHYCHSKDFAPEGKSCVTVSFMNVSYDYWKKLKNTSEEAYKKEKQRLANDVIKELSAVYKEFGKVETIDVVTPVTYERYCGAYRGSYMSFLMTPNAKLDSFNGKISGVENLYMAGQWTDLTGGLPTAAVSGKFALQRICKACGKPVF
jgi:phytoene desaturase